VVRTDLGMTAGKAASQTGHAFLGSFLKASEVDQESYLSERGWTKVVLGVDSEARLREIHTNAINLGLPTSLIEEEGVALAVGIGPAPRGIIRPLTKRLNLLKGECQ
jgi:peptidyl-tRNA hydrolase